MAEIERSLAMNLANTPWGTTGNGGQSTLILERRVWPNDKKEITDAEQERIDAGIRFGKTLPPEAKKFIEACKAKARELYGLEGQPNEVWLLFCAPGQKPQTMHMDSWAMGNTVVFLMMLKALQTQFLPVVVDNVEQIPTSWGTRYG